MLIREILVPTETTVTLELPREMVGKTIELIAFEINTSKTINSPEERLAAIEELTNNSLVDLSGFTFKRDEANNYDDR